MIELSLTVEEAQALLNALAAALAEQPEEKEYRDRLIAVERPLFRQLADAVLEESVRKGKIILK